MLPFVAAAAAVAALALLAELGFAARAAFAGVLSLLCVSAPCTTRRSARKTVVLLFAAARSLLPWRRAAVKCTGGAAALGFLVLVRLPHVVTIAAASILVARRSAAIPACFANAPSSTRASPFRSRRVLRCRSATRVAPLRKSR